MLADIRTVPRSRRNPQFESDKLCSTLEDQGIRYTHFAELGGLRHPRKDSPNRGWRNDSFRGYADYMQTEEFQTGLNNLMALGANYATAIMCAEAVPWRCHRSLIGDALVVRGIEVIDILGERNTRAHALTPWARVDGLQITYPPDEEIQEN